MLLGGLTAYLVNYMVGVAVANFDAEPVHFSDRFYFCFAVLVLKLKDFAKWVHEWMVLTAVAGSRNLIKALTYEYSSE